MGLGELAKVFGLPGKPSEMDGSKVEEPGASPMSPIIVKAMW
jgi:hypothetical protein